MEARLLETSRTHGSRFIPFYVSVYVLLELISQVIEIPRPSLTLCPVSTKGEKKIPYFRPFFVKLHFSFQLRISELVTCYPRSLCTQEKDRHHLHKYINTEISEHVSPKLIPLPQKASLSYQSSKGAFYPQLVNI